MKKIRQIIDRKNKDHILYNKLNYCYQFFTFPQDHAWTTSGLLFFRVVSLVEQIHVTLDLPHDLLQPMRCMCKLGDANFQLRHYKASRFPFASRTSFQSMSRQCSGCFCLEGDIWEAMNPPTAQYPAHLNPCNQLRLVNSQKLKRSVTYF